MAENGEQGDAAALETGKVVVEVLKVEIAKLRLEPGDHLLVRLPEKRLSPSAVLHIMRLIEEIIGVRPLITSIECDISVLTKADLIGLPEVNEGAQVRKTGCSG